MTKKIAVIIGSLRSDSLNRKLAGALEKLAQGKMTFDYLDIGALPHYNDDLWDGSNPPAPVADFKARIEAASGLILVTPEYNRSFPGVLKNALDWASSFPGGNSFTAKPVAITGTSPGAAGTAVAQAHLRLSAISLGCVVMPQPELYLQWTDGRFGADGEIRDDATRAVMQKWVDAATDWMMRQV